MRIRHRLRTLLVAVVACSVCAACGNPASPAGTASPAAGGKGTGWFSYSPMTGTTQQATTDAAAPAPTEAPTRGETSMTDDEFWTIVDRAKGPDPEEVADVLTAELEALEPARIVAFQERYVAQMSRANTYLHLAAAETIMGFTSDDVFVDFRTWVLYQGRAVFESFVAEPDSLAGHGPSDDEQVGAAELLEATPLEVWAAATGGDPDGDAAPNGDAVHDEPRGTPVDRSTIAKRFPRLTAAYVGGAPSGGPAPIVPR